MDFHGKMKLDGALTVVARHCDCCSSRDMLRLTDDQGIEFFYCKLCFTDNCLCAGTKTVTVEK